jgi:L-threonylcarbamoyladenylate synthase
MPLGLYTMVGTDLQTAISFLQQGQLVAVPTETVYGLAANAFNPDAVAQIFAVKNRPSFNPLIIHTNSLNRLKDWGLNLPQKMLQLAEHFSPGPLTYVIPKSNFIPDIVTAGTPAVAVRIPNHPLTLKLLSQLDFPLAAPSANPSGYVSPTTAQHVNQQLGDTLPYILDGGSCNVGVESTIISFLDETPTLLRHGGITLEQIEQVIGKVIDKPGEAGEEILTDNPVAPGQLARHYATKHMLIHDEPKQYFNQFNPQKTAVISFKTNYTQVPQNLQFILSQQGNLAEAAQKLFAAMRMVDELDVDVILAEKFPDEGLGKAINDRLKRASIKQ